MYNDLDYKLAYIGIVPTPIPVHSLEPSPGYAFSICIQRAFMPVTVFPIQTSCPQLVPMMGSASLDMDKDQNPILQTPNVTYYF